MFSRHDLSRNGSPSILFLMPYFGRWPEWMNLFLETCKWNPTIHWLFFTDCGEPANRCPNVRFVQMEKSELEQLVLRKLSVRVQLDLTYKLCDLKPAYGIIFEEFLEGVDYFGFGDIDVVFGDLRKFFTDAVLAYDIISAHSDRLSGHFCLLKNRRRVRNAFRLARTWQGDFQNPSYTCFDESTFSRRVLGLGCKSLHRTVLRFLRGARFRLLAKETYSTILSPNRPWLDGTRVYPSEWYWREGRLTNNKDNDREFPYLHFMNWKSSKYLMREHGQKSAWEVLDRLVNFNDSRVSDGFCISRFGFRTLERAESQPSRAA